MPRTAKPATLSPIERIADLGQLAPCFHGVFNDFDAALSDHPELNIFRPFETYRTPFRQQTLRMQQPPVTKVGPWYSAHQWGAAVDYVPFVGGQWTWELDGKIYAQLHQLADKFGLHAPITWDPGHIVPKNWTKTLSGFVLEKLK